MNNFLFEERVAEEYRRDKMATAEEQNKYAHLSKKKTTLFAYQILSKLGATLEDSGTKMKARYENLALREKRNTLPNLAK